MTRRERGSRLLGLLIPILLGSCAPSPRPPDLVLIVVDTLRADHLGAYGYERPTSPSIDRLAAGGVTFERAYAQAPWTIPSMASLLTGLEPDRMLDDRGDPWGIPEEATTLAEALASRGYTTAAFVANPTMHEGNGFQQGFATFYTAPFELSSFDRHGDELADRVLEWLRGGTARPFFLYVHLLDPHDPYDNEDVLEGRSPFDPGYRGRLRGTDVHALYLGALGLEDPEADLRHLAALYDTEIRFVDRQIGRILEALPGSSHSDTLIALVSDHGEELYERGGFKHGETLYEEMIRVPMILSWPGRLPAGARIPTTVRLLDLFPTLLAAAGAPPDRDRPGLDLLPGLTGRAPIPERPAFARHFSMGPERAAVIYGGRKLMLFDRREAYAPADDREAWVWERDVQRLRRRELYDLREDPEERRPLSEAAEREEEALLRYLDRGWPTGLRLAVTGLAPDRRLRARLELPGSDRALPRYFSAHDEWHREVGSVRFAVRGDGTLRVVLVPGFQGPIGELRLELDGEPWHPRPTLGVDSLPERPPSPGIRLWTRSRSWRWEGSGRDAETERRMRALGYLD